DGGETSLDNLLLLCTTHHKLVHEGGFGIQRDRDGQYCFVRPDGRLLDDTERTVANRVEEMHPRYRANANAFNFVQVDSADGAGWPSDETISRSAETNPCRVKSSIGMPTVSQCDAKRRIGRRTPAS